MVSRTGQARSRGPSCWGDSREAASGQCRGPAPQLCWCPFRGLAVSILQMTLPPTERKVTPPVPSSSTTCDSSPHTPPSVPTAAFLFWPQRTDRLPFFEVSTASSAHPQSSHLPPSLSFIVSLSVSPFLLSACKQAQSSSTLKSSPSGSESPYPPPHLTPSQTGGLWHRLSPDCPHTWVRLTTEDPLCAHCWENNVGHDRQGHLPREAHSPGGNRS